MAGTYHWLLHYKFIIISMLNDPCMHTQCKPAKLLVYNNIQIARLENTIIEIPKPGSIRSTDVSIGTMLEQ